MIKILDNEENFEEEVDKDLVLLYFYADWCGACQTMQKVIENVTQCDVLKINVDDFHMVAKEYEVMSIPTMYLLKKGEAVARKVGALSKTELLDWISSYQK